MIDKQIEKDITRGRVAVYAPNFPYISSSLGLVPKPDDGFRRIHHGISPIHLGNLPMIQYHLLMAICATLYA